MTSGIAPVPSTTRSASSTRPDSRDDALHAAVALEARQRVRRHAVDPVRVQHAGEEAARRLAEAGRQRRVLDHDERALLAHRGQRRRDLAGDVGAADQHDALGLLGVGPDRRGVAERAQVVDALEVAAVDAQPAHVRARGEQRLAEADLVLGRERRGARVRGRASSRSCASAARCRARAYQSAGCSSASSGGRLAAQQVLRARRPLVRRLRLAARRAGSSRRSRARAAPRRTTRRRGPPPTIRTSALRCAHRQPPGRRRRRTAR